uniref:Putative structural protein n=1 Tax=viral metagenome TaxID=1070528 RepID=A0A6H1ZLM6_9ZZZZ
MAYNAGVKQSYTGGSTGVMYTDRRDFYLTPNTVAELYKTASPFTSVLGRFGTKRTYDPDFKLFEHRAGWLNMKCYLAQATAALTEGTAITTVRLDNGAGALTGYFSTETEAEGTVLDVWDSTCTTHKTTGYISIITKGTTYHTVSYYPIWVAVSGTTAFADNDVAFIQTNAREEGGKATHAWDSPMEVVYNTSAIMKTSLEITGTLLAMSQLRGGSNELARFRDLKAKEHKIKQAKALYFSRRYGGTDEAIGGTTPDKFVGPNGRRVRTMHGIIPVIEDYNSASNVHNITMASYTWDDFVDDIVVWFEYSNDNMVKWLFCGDAVMAFFSKIGSSGFIDGGTFQLNLNMNASETKLGINVNTLETGMGSIRLVRDQLFSKGFNDTVGSVRPFTGWGVLVDPENISKVIFRPDKYQTGLADNSYGGELLLEQYFSDWGLGITLAETHHMLKFA